MPSWDQNLEGRMPPMFSRLHSPIMWCAVLRQHHGLMRLYAKRSLQSVLCKSTRAGLFVDCGCLAAAAGADSVRMQLQVWQSKYAWWPMRMRTVCGVCFAVCCSSSEKCFVRIIQSSMAVMKVLTIANYMAGCRLQQGCELFTVLIHAG